MEIKQCDQLIFDEMFKRSSQMLEYNTYLTLPDLQVSYPFVVIGETQLIPKPTKSGIVGTVSLTIHVWGAGGNRIQVSNMISELYRVAANIERIGKVYFTMDLTSGSTILHDNSTKEELIHGVLDLSFGFY